MEIGGTEKFLDKQVKNPHRYSGEPIIV